MADNDVSTTIGDEAERVSWIMKSMREARDHSAQWRKDARLCYDFRAGKQWTEDERAEMELARKPIIVFNRIERAIRAVLGLEIQNRQEVRFMPRGVEDTALSEVMGAAADWARDNADAEDEESEAFSDLLTGGMGWICTELEYEADPNGKLLIERVDPLDMFWDPSARRKGLKDARWVAHVKRVTRDDIVGMWPQYADMISTEASTQATFLDDADSPHFNNPPGYDTPSPNSTKPRDKELICFQWWEHERFYRAQTPAGLVELSEVKYQALGEMLAAQGVQVVAQKRRSYRKAYVADGHLLEEIALPVQKSGFTYKCITGARDRNSNTWFGLVTLMLDPQRFANKWLSQITHVLNKSAKGGLLAEQDAFANPSQAQESWAKAEVITWVNPGAISGGKVQPKPEQTFPEGYGKLLEFAVNSIMDTAGISQELLGMTGMNQPGIVEEARKRAGFTILALFFDSIRLYRKEHGRLLAEYIREYLSDGRLIRIVGPQGAQHVPLVRDQLALEYDVIVDESPTSPNNKERTFSLMTQLAPVLAQAGVPLPPDILDYSPLPSALVEKWKAHIQQNKQLPPQVQALMQDMQSTIQAQQAEIGKMAADKLKMETDKTVELYKITEQAKVDRQLAIIKAESESEKRGVEVYEANLKALMDKLGMISDTFAQAAKQQAEARPQMLVTEQAAGGLSQALLPALAQLMEVSQAQTAHLQGLQTLPNALAQLGQQITQAIQGQRLVASEPVYDPASGRLSAIRRTFADGSSDELPYRRQETLQ